MGIIQGNTVYLSQFHPVTTATGAKEFSVKSNYKDGPVESTETRQG